MRAVGRLIGTLALVAFGIGATAELGISAFSAGLAGGSPAATYVVNDASDSATGSPAACASGSGDCTLRAAITEANGSGEDIAITLPDPSSVANNPASVYSVNSATGILDIASGHEVDINGAGQGIAVIQEMCSPSCSVTTGVFSVDTAGTDAVISGVTIEGGNATSGNGGGIFNDEVLTLNNSTVTGNTASDQGGGIATDLGTQTTLNDDVISDNAAQGNDGGGVFVSSGNLTITGGTIGGVGSTSPFDQGNQANQGGGAVSFQSSGQLSLSGVTIGGENSTQGNSSGNRAGGVYTQDGDATFSDDTITDNTTVNGGGGVYVESGTASFTNETINDNSATTGDGGGVYVFGGTTTFSGNTISENTSTDGDGGGGVFIDGGTNSFTGDTLENDVADNGNGGGVYVNDGSNTFSDETINANEAEYDDTNGGDGGGVYLDAGTNTFSGGSVSENTSLDGDDGDGGGGGVYINDGTNSFSGVSIDSNETKDGTVGGGVYIDAGTNTFSAGSISSNQAQAGGFGGGGYLNGGANTFTTETVDSNKAIWTSGENGDGGGFYVNDGTNTFTGGSIDSNRAYSGGGAYLFDGTTSFSQSDISSNTASEGGAGLFVWTDGSPTTVTQSTISNNHVSVPSIGVTSFVGDGGGILSYFCQDITLTNDTITGNSAPNAGGGYYSQNCGLVAGSNLPPGTTSHDEQKPASQPHSAPGSTSAFLFDTFDSNSAGDANGGGNIQQDDDTAITIQNTIVANGITGGAAGRNCEIDTAAGAVFTSLGYNLVDDTTCGTPAATDIIGQSPQLGPLANNGGPTKTMLPADSAPEVGAIPDATCVASGVGTDQRGIARGAGANSSCTIGSVEVGQNFNGYRLVADEGGIFDFGLLFSGSLANNHLNAPIVGLANAPGPAGYLMVGSDGGVFALGGANFFGSLGGQTIPSPISAIAAPPNESGYWLVAQNGKIYNYGSVPALPALSPPPGAHIVGMASTTDGQGAWLVDNFGDVYAEGTAHYVGGLGGVHINQPIVGIAAAASGQGYALVAADGGVFAYGTQNFFGSVPGSLKPGQNLNAPIVGIAVTHSGRGYWEVGADGGVFTYGDAPFLGSMAGIRLNGPVVGIQHLGSVNVPG